MFKDHKFATELRWQNPERQSESEEHATLSGQGSQGPPHLTPHSGGWHLLVNSEHMPESQSSSRKQCDPLEHARHEFPPQSTPVSLPDRTPSWQSGCVHAPAWHSPEAQSLDDVHGANAAHLAAHEPPQSTKASLPSNTPLKHVAGTTTRRVASHTSPSEASASACEPHDAPTDWHGKHPDLAELPQSTLASSGSRTPLRHDALTHRSASGSHLAPLPRQSASTAHEDSGSHVLRHAPPQSTSVSNPRSRTRLKQCLGRQISASRSHREPLTQSTSVVHGPAPTSHGSHTPPHLKPPPPGRGTAHDSPRHTPRLPHFLEAHWSSRVHGSPARQPGHPGVPHGGAAAAPLPPTPRRPGLHSRGKHLPCSQYSDAHIKSCWHAAPTAQRGHKGSWPHCDPHAARRHTKRSGSHMPLRQSWFVSHAPPSGHGSHVSPPQSTPVSFPLVRPSRHDAGWHFPVRSPHAPEEQSVPYKHASPSRHLRTQLVPPQSTSTSVPSVTPLRQLAGTHDWVSTSHAGVPGSDAQSCDVVHV